MELRVAPPEAQHSVGALVWGQGASTDTLFASSEAQIMTDYSGFHAAFDPDQGRRTYEFSAEESGDAMASDPDGSALRAQSEIRKLTISLSTGARLALCTAARDGTHFLRLYDIRRKDGQHPLQTIQLDTFFVGPDSSPSQLEPREGEVRAVSFSPDGLLLAVSRSDDELHIYDSRFMGRNLEPMRRFVHWEEDCCLGGDRWGIVDAVWVDGWCGRGLGVVTGGSDGEIFYHITPHARPYLSLCFCKKAAFVSGTYAGRATISRTAKCLRGQTQTSAISPSAILTTEKSHSSCGCTVLRLCS